MLTDVYSSQIDDLTHKLRFTRHMAYGAIVLCLILATKIVTTTENQKTILTPPTITAPFWVQGGVVSPSYVSQMSQWVLQLALTVNPDTIEYQKRLYLEYIRPDQQSVLGKLMDEKIDAIRRLGAHQVFYPMDIMTKGLYARVNGILDTYVGDKRIQSVNKTYQIAYVVDDRLWVSAIQDISGKTDTQLGWQPATITNPVSGATVSADTPINRNFDPAIAADAPSPGPQDVPAVKKTDGAIAAFSPSISQAAVGRSAQTSPSKAVQGPIPTPIGPEVPSRRSPSSVPLL